VAFALFGSSPHNCKPDGLMLGLKRDIGRTARRVVLLCDAEGIGIAIKSLSDFTNVLLAFDNGRITPKLISTGLQILNRHLAAFAGNS
jgi:hypothetical protein